MHAASDCTTKRSPWKCFAAKLHILQRRMCSICAALLPVLAMGPALHALPPGLLRLLKAPASRPESVLKLSLRSCNTGGLTVCIKMLPLLVLLLWSGSTIDATAAVRSGWMSPRMRGTSRSRRASILLPGASRSS